MTVLAVQNMIHSNSIFARLANGKADYLSGRIVSGPHPALTDFSYRAEDGMWAIDGVPTWDGQDLAACLSLVNLIGPRQFKRECQHEIGDREGALWTRAMIDGHRVTSVPALSRVVVAVDPAATSNDTSDEAGIVGAGRFGQSGYVLEDRTMRGTPAQWASEAIAMYHRLKANVIIAEANNGGEMVKFVINSIDATVPVELVWAAQGKQTRAEPVSALYEQGRMHHVGTLAALEDEQCSWLPLEGKSPNRIDALVWAVFGLGLTQRGGVGP